MPRPGTDSYSLATRVYFSDPADTSHWLNHNFSRSGSTLLYVTGPLHISNVFIQSVSAVRSLTQRDAPYIKSPTFINLVESFVGKVAILNSRGERHYRERRLVSPTLRHDFIVAHLQKSIYAEGHKICDQFSHMTGGFDPSNIIRSGTLRVIAEACFGSDFFNDKTFNRLLELYNQSLEINIFPTFLRTMFVGFPVKLPLHWISRAEQAKVDLQAYVRSLSKTLRLLNAKDENVSRHSFLSHISVDSDPDQQLSPDEKTSAVLTFLIAGQATTMVAVSWVLYMLGQHTDWQERIHDEIEGKIDDMGELSQLPILNAVIKEVLRLYPPLQDIGRQVQNPDGPGIVLDGHFLPNGTNINVAILALQTRKDVWGSDALDFKPSRWLGDNAAQMHRDAKFMWATFWFGMHGCIGQRLAMLEITVFVALVVKSFKISVDHRNDGVPRRQGNNSAPINMKLHVKRRV